MWFVAALQKKGPALTVLLLSRSFNFDATFVISVVCNGFHIYIEIKKLGLGVRI